MSDLMNPEDGKTPARGGYGVPKVRERVIRMLQQAYSAGDLELEDYESRVQRAEDAATVDELKAVVSDFPDHAMSAHAPGSLPATSPDAETAGPFYLTLLGDRDILPDDLENNAASVLSIIGDVKIDLSRTGAPEGSTFDITSVSFIGDTKIIVPKGTRIVRRQLSLIGDFKRRTRQPEPKTERYTLVLRGFKLIGDVKVREA